MAENSRGKAISAYIPAFSKGALVYGANIQSGVITSAHIADGTVVAADVAAGSITSAKLGTGAVTNVKILAGAVTSAKLGAGAVKKVAMRAAYLTGTVSANIGAFAMPHGLGAVPAIVIVGQRATSAALNISGFGVAQSTVSANTSAVIFLAARASGTKFAAYVQI